MGKIVNQKYITLDETDYVVTTQQNQGVTETDWVKYRVLTKDYSPLPINSNSTATNLIIDKYNKALVERTDPFGDSSEIAFYQLEGNANDAHGNYNGVWVGTEAYSSGKFGQAGSFNGTDNYINLGNYDLGTNIVVSVWIYRFDDPEYGCIAGFSNNSLIMGFSAYNGKTDIWTYSGGSYYGLSSVVEIPLQEWHHVVYQYLNGTALLYIDGIFKTNETLPVADTGATDGNSIGTKLWQQATTNVFAGYIDQLRIFNRELTADEVTQLYNEQYLKIKENDQIIIYNSTDGSKVHEITNLTENVDNYEIDISSLSLAAIPTNAHLLTTKKLVQEDTVNNIDPFGDRSLILKYQFEGNTNDLLGNYNGTAYGTPAYTTGKFGQAIELDGVDDYIDTGYTHTGTATSVSFWCNLNDVTNIQEIFSDIDSTGNAALTRIHLSLNNTSGYYHFSIGDGTNSWTDDSISHNLSTGTWYHHVLVIDGTSVKLYKDNVLVANLTSTYSLSNGTQTLKIGTDGDSTSYFLNGKIDQLQIFNRALTSDEVTQLYRESKNYYARYIHPDTTSSSLVLLSPLTQNTLVKNGESVVVYNLSDGYKKLDDVTITKSLSSGNILYTIDISSLLLTTVPTEAYIIKPRVDVSFTTNEDTANVDDIVLDVDTANTTTDVVKTLNYKENYNTSTQNRIKNATKVDLDTGLAVDCSVIEVYQDPSSTDPFGDSSEIAFYQLEGNANDAHGNYNGVWVGTEAYSSGKFGQAGSFNGTDNYINLGNYDLGTNIVVSVWIYRFDDPEYGCIAGFSNNSVKLGFRASDNDTLIWTYYSGTYYTSSSAGIIPLQEWHHVVYQYLNGTVLIYVDGILKINETITLPDTGATDGNSIGTKLWQQATTNVFAGYIDQLRIFNRELTADEVTQLYNEGKYKYSISIGTTQATNPTTAIIRPTISDILSIDSTNTTYDSINDLVNVNYNEVDKTANTGRCIQVKWEGQQITEENSKIQVDLWKA